MSDSRLLLGSTAWLVTVSILLNLAGIGPAFAYAGPVNPAEVEGEEETQTFVGAAWSCVLSVFQSCSQITQTKIVRTITNVVSFAVASFDYLFQLMSFQIEELPVWLNAIIVIPPASTQAFIALKTIRGTGG